MSSDQVWLKLPKFSGKNFQGWKRQLLVTFTNRGLSHRLQEAKDPEGITSGRDRPDEAKDESAREAHNKAEEEESLAQGLIFNAIDETIMEKVQTCKTADAIWKRLLLFDENSSQTNIDRLLHEYHTYRKDPNQDMATHISRVESMADQLTELGEPQSERSAVFKLLNSLPDNYQSLKDAWDASSPTFRTKDELITRLIKHEQTKVGQAAQRRSERSSISC